MADFPRSLVEFERRFPVERTCAAYLAQVRAGRTASAVRLDPHHDDCLSLNDVMLVSPHLEQVRRMRARSPGTQRPPQQDTVG